MDTTTIAEVAAIVLLGLLLMGVIKIKGAKKQADDGVTLLQDRAANEPLTLAESIRAKIEAQKEPENK
jgi:hypothetical protein